MRTRERLLFPLVPPALFLSAIAVSCGCAVRTADLSLPAEVPPSFSESGTAILPERWWLAFGDAELDRLVERALEGNFDLWTAWHRLRQASAVAEREAGFLYPDLEAELSATVRRPVGDAGDFDGDFDGGFDGPDGETLQLGLSSVYEVDLWGRVHAAADAEHLRARATLADYRVAALSLSAEVALAWYRLVEARGQRALLRAQVETNETVLDLIETRFGTGQIRRVDILRQRQLVEATRTQLLSVGARVQILEHLLAVLLGRPPREDVVAAPREELPHLPPLPDAGLPAELLRRRPDVQRAHALLLAADRELAAAVADRYPRLTLTASASTEDEGMEDLFDEWFRALTGSLVTPLFDAGRRRAEVDRAEALEQERLHQYAQTALVAFREVEDALIQEKKQVERIDSLAAQLELADRTYEQLQTEYFNGVGDYVDVLLVLVERQELRRTLLSARLLLLEFRIALYRALAGGFETAREASV